MDKRDIRISVTNRGVTGKYRAIILDANDVEIVSLEGYERRETAVEVAFAMRVGYMAALNTGAVRGLSE